MTDRYVIAYDGSDPSRDALEYAIEHFPDAELVVVHVVEVLEGYWTAYADFEELSEAGHPAADQIQKKGERVIEEARELASEHGRDVETVLQAGDPARRIVSEAEDVNADGIVIGSHGRTGGSRVLFGSVAENVVRRAPVPVTVVR